MLTKAIKRVVRDATRISVKGQKCGPHITRYGMYRHLSNFRRSAPADAKVLSISHSKSLCELLGLGHCQITEANYPDVNILNLPFAENEFDYVVSDQVLEHIEGNPQVAMDETHRVLKFGGVAIHTTCFIMPLHGSPSDFWRYTPNALSLLCKKFSRIIDVGGWGNIYVWALEWLGLRFDGIPETSWHPLNKITQFNDPAWPAVTWIIAQK